MTHYFSEYGSGTTISIMRIPAMRPKNLHAGQEGTVRTGHETTDWFQIGKEYVRLYIVTLLI